LIDLVTEEADPLNHLISESSSSESSEFNIFNDIIPEEQSKESSVIKSQLSKSSSSSQCREQQEKAMDLLI
jgi:hypothetical protein